MSLTAAFFLLAYFSGLLLAIFRHPRFGLYTYLFAIYMHPVERWWRDQVPGLRWSFIAALVTLGVLIANGGNGAAMSQWAKTPVARYLIFTTALLTIQLTWSVTGGYQMEGLVLVAKYSILSFLIFRLVDSEAELRNFALIHVLGCFYLGWVAASMTISGRFEGVGAPGVDGANQFGLFMVTGAIFAGMLLLRGGNLIRAGLVLVTPFILNGFVATQSRGVFLGALSAAGMAYLFKPRDKKLIFYSAGVLAVILAILLIPDNFIERIQTIKLTTNTEEASDSSSETRLVLAAAQLEMAKDYPLGAGFRGTEALSRFYLDERYLTGRNADGRATARASHNSPLTALVDYGIAGFIALIWILIRSMKTLRAIYKDLLTSNSTAKDFLDLSNYAMGFAGALALWMVAGLFSNYFRMEVFVWMLSLTFALQNVYERLKARDEAPEASPGAEPETPKQRRGYKTRNMKSAAEFTKYR